MTTPKTVPYEIFDELRRDRDGWKTKHRLVLAAAQAMERELADYKRSRKVVEHARPNPLDELFKPVAISE